MTRGVVPKRNISECILKEYGSGTTLHGFALPGSHSLRSSPRTISTAVLIVLPSSTQEGSPADFDTPNLL